MSLPVTRSYPIPPLPPVLALVRNALSPVPELGIPATTQLLAWLTPRVEHVLSTMTPGLRGPRIPLGLAREQALATLYAQLDTCTATTDAQFCAWVSARTTDALLDFHRTLRAASGSRSAAA